MSEITPNACYMVPSISLHGVTTIEKMGEGSKCHVPITGLQSKGQKYFPNGKEQSLNENM
jgi:hypothetical protein